MLFGGISRSQRIINGRTDPYEGSPPRLLPPSDKDWLVCFPHRNLQVFQRTCSRTLIAAMTLTKLIIVLFELCSLTWSEWLRNIRRHHERWSWWVSREDNKFRDGRVGSEGGGEGRVRLYSGMGLECFSWWWQVLRHLCASDWGVRWVKKTLASTFL